MSALATQTAISTLVVLVTAEFLPKSFFHGAPNRWLRFFSLPLVMAFYLLWPLAMVVLALSHLFLKKQTTKVNSQNKTHEFIRGFYFALLNYLRTT